MADIRLTMGFTDYDHVRDLFTGRVKPEGIELTCLRMEVEESFLRFLKHQEWDISEMSLGMACAAVARGDAPFVILPVFPSRVFRLSGVYIRANGRVAKPADLRGKRIGIPQWTQTATIFIRGWMTDTLGIPLKEVEWFQMGATAPGRIDTSAVRPPEGVSLTDVTDRGLGEMLAAGEIDALLCASPPRLFEENDPRVVRLFPDHVQAEQDYFAQTGIYPIMHTVVIKRKTYETYPWVARNVFNAFEEAKHRSIERIQDLGVSQIIVPWLPALFERYKASIFPHGDYWAYGIEKNRTTLEAFLKFSFDQGVINRRIALEELFCRESLEPFSRLRV
jgi:4,5-dihydroxyphthalate decarboxylase